MPKKDDEHELNEDSSDEDILDSEDSDDEWDPLGIMMWVYN